MKRIHVSLIKVECIKYAANNDMQIETLDNETFLARGPDTIIHVPISFLYDQFQNGWSINDTLENETCHLEAV